jgi:hypothetical protein
MRDPDHKVAVPAAIALWDRGFGKPNIRVETGGPQSITVLHLVAAREITDEIMRALNNGGDTTQPTIDGEAANGEDAAPVDLTQPALE